MKKHQFPKQKNFRLSVREAKAVEKAARTAGVSESTWLRLVVRAALGETDLIEQLSRAMRTSTADASASESSGRKSSASRKRLPSRG